MSFAITRARLGAVVTTTVTAGVIVGSTLALTAAPASAAPARPMTSATQPTIAHHLTKKQREHKRYEKKVHKVLSFAAKQKGKPYVYGGAGPRSFDCSGLVMYVFKHAVGRSLPHNAAAQYRYSHHISRKHLRRGDLVFVDNGGYISHVGIYDGHHHWWVAPHTGTRVQRQYIYHAHFLYGRILQP
jgi:cell wall-associated NlpC family hydrolase